MKAFVSQPVRVFSKINEYMKKIIFLSLEAGLRKQKREEEEDKEGCVRGCVNVCVCVNYETVEMWLILQAKRLISQVPLHSPC